VENRAGMWDEPTGMTYAFEACELDTERFELRRDGALVPMEPQVFDVLDYLVRHRERVVSKEELLDNVWGDRFVSESALTSRIKAARRAIGDDGQAQRCIRTAHGRGYRFVADVRSAAAGDPSASARQDLQRRRREQIIRFVTADDGVRLAYSTVGDGPPLVKAANWLSHLDHDWESKVWRHWWRDLSADRTLIRYDERGCGLSDWDVEDFDLETWVRDLECVVDACGIDRFPLLGVSQGGPVAIEYAARHPERVSALVLYGTFARGRMVRSTSERERDEASLQVELVRLGWGRNDATFRQFFAMQFLPNGTREQWDQFDELQRRSTTPLNARMFMEAFGTIDVTESARSLRVPTIVVHARGDLRSPLPVAREVAALIPGSRLITLDSPNHLLTEDEPAWTRFVEEVRAFLDAKA